MTSKDEIFGLVQAVLSAVFDSFVTSTRAAAERLVPFLIFFFSTANGLAHRGFSQSYELFSTMGQGARGGIVGTHR